MSEPLQLRRANKWRAALNPLRGLTIQRVVMLLEDGERGAYADLQWAYRFAEKRDATLRGLKRLRLAAIGRLDWDIKTVDESPAAKKQADALRAAYDRIENLNAAIRFLALAEFRGFSHLEKRYEDDNPGSGVIRLEPVEQWYWCRDTTLGPWQYNAEAVGRTEGEEVDLQHFIVREVDDPIDEIGLPGLVYMGMGKKDWAGFIEVYGIPPLFGMLPPNVTQENAAKFQEMMEAVIADMRGTIPNGADVKTIDGGARGVNPFAEFVKFWKEETVLAGTSGKLTMLNDSTGLGSGQSDLHQDVFDDLAEAEAAEISELLQAQFDQPILQAQFQGQPTLAYFQLAAEDAEDVDAVFDRAVKAQQAGFAMDAAEISEKTGYTLTAAPPPAPPPASGSRPGVFNRQSPIANRQAAAEPTAAQLAEATTREAIRALDAELVAPLRARALAAFEHDDPEAIAAALEELRAQLPTALRRLRIDGPTAQAIEAGLVAALMNGITEAETARPAPSLLNRLIRIFRS